MFCWVSALACWLSLSTQTVWRRRPITPSTGQLESSCLATTLVLVMGKTIQSSRVECGAATSSGASSLPAWRPLSLTLTPMARETQRLVKKTTDCKVLLQDLRGSLSSLSPPPSKAILAQMYENDMKRSMRRSLIGMRIGPVNITKTFHQRGSGWWATQGFTSLSSSPPSLSSSLESGLVFDVLFSSIVLLCSLHGTHEISTHWHRTFPQPPADSDQPTLSSLSQQ